MGFMEGAERFAAVSSWLLAALLVLCVVLVLADLTVGILVARHARRGGRWP